MPLRVSNEQRQLRLSIRHRLSRDCASDDPETIAKDLVAVHSSDPATVYLSIAARLVAPTVESIAKAINADRSLVRHHAMRRTIWVMTNQVARWAHASATAKIAKKSRQQIIKAFSECPEIGNGEKWLDQATRKIAKLLSKNGTMSAREIGQQLPELVIPVRFGTEKHFASVNAHTKVLQLGGFESTFVRGDATGGWVSGEFIWSVTDDWLEQPIEGLDEMESAAELLKLWLKGFGPATLDDIRWYFGWTAKLAKSALDTIQAQQVELDDQSIGWILENDLAKLDKVDPWVQLLPGLDASTMGWKNRDWYIDPDVVPMLFDRFGNAGPVIWADGKVIGSWIQKPDGSIAYQLTEKIGRKHQKLLNDAIDRTVAFCGDVIVRPRFPAKIQKELLKS